MHVWAKVQAAACVVGCVARWRRQQHTPVIATPPPRCRSMVMQLACARCSLSLSPVALPWCSTPLSRPLLACLPFQLRLATPRSHREHCLALSPYLPSTYPPTLCRLTSLDLRAPAEYLKPGLPTLGELQVC